jgi:hypothetical protein
MTLVIALELVPILLVLAPVFAIIGVAIVLIRRSNGQEVCHEQDRAPEHR